MSQSKQPSRRFNFNSNRQNAPLGTVLSTISSVGAEEDEACMTDIEEPDNDKLEAKAQKSGNQNEENLALPTSSSEDRPKSVRSISAIPSIISSIIGGRQSTVNRSSTASTTSSNVLLPTISEGFHTPPNQQSISIEHQSLGSTLVATSPKLDVIEKAPTVSESPLSTTSSGKRTTYSKSRYTTGTTNQISSDGAVSIDPRSRFSWHVTNVDKAKSFYTKWFINWWLFEIICWIISAVLMAIILAVLAHFDGKTIPQWHVGMTLNAFVSVLSGFSRAALLLPVAEALGQLKWNWFTKKPKPMYDFEILDSASRGPLGSFVLLAHFKGITLASIGAAVILLTIPLDLFFQQIVAYPTVWVKTDQIANLTRGIYYQNAAVFSDFVVEGSAYQDFALYGTISSYLLQSPIPVILPSQCPTSNCTWPQFDTLAMCSQCADMTNDRSVIQYGCFESSNDWVPYVVPSYMPQNATNITTCGYYFNPPGLNQPPILVSGFQTSEDNSLSSQGSTGSIGSVLVGRHVPTTDWYTEQFIIPDGSINFKNIQNPIVNFIIANTPGGKQAVLNKVTPTVQECSLYWCVKTLTASSQYGVYNETLLGSTPLKSTMVNSSSDQQPWTVSSNPEAAPYNGDYDPSYSLTRPDEFASEGGTTIYGADNVTTRAIIISFADFIPASWGYLDNATETDLEVKFAWEVSVFGAPPEQYKVPKSHWEGVDISSTFESLAQSLTNVVRQYNINNTGIYASVPGDSYTSEVHVQLRLEWAALPGGLLLFSLIFLLSTVWRTTDAAKVGIWKTSALAVLFNGIGEDVEAQVGNKVKIADARKKAKQMEVQLEDE